MKLCLRVHLSVFCPGFALLHLKELLLVLWAHPVSVVCAVHSPLPNRRITDTAFDCFFATYQAVEERAGVGTVPGTVRCVSPCGSCRRCYSTSHAGAERSSQYPGASCKTSPVEHGPSCLLCCCRKRGRSVRYGRLRWGNVILHSLLLVSMLNHAGDCGKGERGLISPVGLNHLHARWTCFIEKR